MIDIGVNLTNKQFQHDMDDVVERAKLADVLAMIVTGTNISESVAALKLSQQYPHYLFATAGVHPHDADQASNDFINDIIDLIQNDAVVAIGECGLDFNRNFSTPQNQMRVFNAQVELAAEKAMPIFLHQRDAFAQWYQVLSPYIDKIPAMVSHCFTGSKKELEQCLDAGMYIGITGWLCDKKRGQALREIVPLIPLERLMIETDAPFLLPQNIDKKIKNRRNEPCFLPNIVHTLAQLYGCEKNIIIKHTMSNAKNFFNLSI